MGNTSSVVTGGVTFSAAALAPTIQWALTGFPQPIPESTPLLIGAGLITVGHAVYNLATAYFAKKWAQQGDQK